MRRDCFMQELLKMKSHLICGGKVLVGGGGNRHEEHVIVGRHLPWSKFSSPSA